MTMKTSLLALVAGAALALPLAALAEGSTVKSVKVEADMTAIQNPDAAMWWGRLTGDLEGAILARVNDRIADDGAKLAVDISEVDLAKGFAGPGDLANAVLKGTVTQTHDSDNSRFENYELTVDVKASLPALGSDLDLTAADVDTSKLYRAMIDTFADQVAQSVK